MRPRVLLFTGPPGAGTSTVAAAAAHHAAAGGARTLLVTSSVRHPLLTEPVPSGEGPVPVAAHLWVLADGGGGPAAEPAPGPPIRAVAARLLTALERRGRADARWDVVVAEGAVEVVGATLDRLAAEGVPDDGGRVHLVVDPPRTAHAQVQRLVTGWALHGHRPAALLVNRPPADAAVRRWVERWRAAEAGLPAGLRGRWGALEVHRIPGVPPELRGRAQLGALAPHVAPVLATGGPGDHQPTVAITRAGDGYELAIELPFVGQEEVEVTRQGAVLALTAAGHRRLLHLPDSLRRRAVTSATLADGRLVVRFAGPAREGAGPAAGAPPDGDRGSVAGRAR